MVQPCMLLIQGYAFSFAMFADETTWERAPSILWWLTLHAMLTHFHIFYVAPLTALLIRHAVSRQREYLADADAAQLTRDPEGLALALIKVATARGKSCGSATEWSICICGSASGSRLLDAASLPVPSAG